MLYHTYIPRTMCFKCYFRQEWPSLLLATGMMIGGGWGFYISQTTVNKILFGTMAFSGAAFAHQTLTQGEHRQQNGDYFADMTYKQRKQQEDRDWREKELHDMKLAKFERKYGTLYPQSPSYYD